MGTDAPLRLSLWGHLGARFLRLRLDRLTCLALGLNPQAR
jgi:hypothetical protein